MRILVVEDDQLLGEGLCAGLRQNRYAVDWVGNADQAEHALQAEHFHLAIVDLGLPGRDGFELLESMRNNGHGLPVLILTARDHVPDRVRGLDCGADDYMVKPFDLDELNARLRALLRRSGGNASPLMSIGELTLDPAALQVTYLGRQIELFPKELALLRTLMTRAGKVVPRAVLQESIYSWDEEVESNALEVHIHNLRRKLDKQLIRTVRGVGYMLTASGN